MLVNMCVKLIEAEQINNDLSLEWIYDQKHVYRKTFKSGKYIDTFLAQTIQNLSEI